MLKLGVKFLSVACVLGLGVGCGNVKYPPKKPKPTTVTETPQNQTAAQAPSTPVQVLAGAPDLKALKTSLTSVNLSYAPSTSKVSLSFSHLSADKIQSDGLPSVINVANLQGELGKDLVVTLEDPSAPGYAAQVTCADTACSSSIVDLTLTSGKQAGSAKILVTSASDLTLGITLQGESATAVEKALATQAKSNLKSSSGVGLYRVEGGKTFFVARTVILPPANLAIENPDYFEKHVIAVSGTLGKVVSIALNDLTVLKSGPVTLPTTTLVGSADISDQPFGLRIKPSKSGIEGLAYFVAPVTDATTGTAGTQVKTQASPKPSTTPQ